MRFQVARSSLGAVSAQPPCPGAVRGPEAAAWPGEYTWFVDFADFAALQAFLENHGGALGLFAAEEGEEHPMIEIFDDDEDDG